MSRSLKQAIFKYAPVGRSGKKSANRAVRRFTDDIADGGAYKKVFEQWDVHDCISDARFEDKEFANYWESRFDEPYPRERKAKEINGIYYVSK